MPNSYPFGADPMTKIYAVIHHLNPSLSLAQAKLAVDGGADGVFLISHEGEDSAVAQVAGQLRYIWDTWPAQPDAAAPFIGVNLLQTNPSSALVLAASLRLDAVWIDAPGVSSGGPTPGAQLLTECMRRHPGVSVFGSVAFKYQPVDPDPAGAAAQARAAGMIPTTSGAATGVAPSLLKVKSMSAATGGLLAVASGMTPANVAAYTPFLSHILVATGISRAEHFIDPQLLAQFVAAARGPARAA